MKQGTFYKLTSPTLAIHSVDGQQRPVTMPVNALVKFMQPGVEDAKFVEVEWQTKRLLMFAVDLEDRGVLVRAARA